MRLFTKSDVVVLLVIAVGGLLAVLPPNGHAPERVRCMAHVRQLVGLLEFDHADPTDRNLALYLLEKGDLRSGDELELLFCPGDSLDRDERATSYAWRDQSLPGCRVTPGTSLALICDDSADHHDTKGFVVGYTGGAVRWRDKVHDWELRHDAQVTVGKDSVVPELRCLRTD